MRLRFFCRSAGWDVPFPDYHESLGGLIRPSRQPKRLHPNPAVVVPDAGVHVRAGGVGVGGVGAEEHRLPPGEVALGHLAEAGVEVAQVGALGAETVGGIGEDEPGRGVGGRGVVEPGVGGAAAGADGLPELGAGGEGMGSSEESSAPVKYDTLFAEIAREAVSGGQISTSMIQRNYEVGFNRAGRIMMQLERAGIVGRQEGAKPRDILYHDLPSLEAKLQELGVF